MASTITIHSSDGEEFLVERNVIALSKTLNIMIRDLGLDEMESPMPIPLPNVGSETLKKILEWCRQHKDDEILEAPRDPKAKQCEVPEWDKKFLELEDGMIYHIINAANYLDIPNLLDYSCQTVADKLKGKEVEQLRKEFDIENDFTPEEYIEVEAASSWCLE